MPVAAAITGAAALGTTLLNNYMNKRRYEQQLKDERGNWYMNNSYNSPVAQMQRLKAAGLNPNLVYQNGAAVQPSSQPSTPDYQYEPINGAEIVNSAYQADSTQAAIDQTVANTKKTNAETADLLKDQRIRDTPIGMLSEWSLFTREEKEAIASSFGMTTPQLEQSNFRFLGNRALYEQEAKNNKQLSTLLDIIDQQRNTAISQAVSAYYQSIVDMMMAHSEASSRGWTIYDTNVGEFTKSSGAKKNAKAFDYAAGLTIKAYNQLVENISDSEWENTGWRRGVRSFSDILSGVGNIWGIGSILKKAPASIGEIERTLQRGNRTIRETTRYKYNH